MSRFFPWILLLASGLVLACDGDATGTPDVQLAPLVTYKAQVKNDTLTLTNGASDSRLALRLATPTTLAVDVGDDGNADFIFDRSTFSKIVVDAGGGKDTLRVDEQSGVFSQEEAITLRGGAGQDSLLGGVGPDTLEGGGDADRLEGSFGVDTLIGGGGNDVFVWGPGGASDVIDGGTGSDRLAMSGSGAAERFTLRASGPPMSLLRDVANVVLDTAGLEDIELTTAAGADNVVVEDLATTTVERVTVDLFANGGAGDLVQDTVTLSGVGAIDVAAIGAAVVASDGAVDVAVVRGEPGYNRLVAGNGGAATVNGTDLGEVFNVVAVGGVAHVYGADWNVGVASGGGRLVVAAHGGDDEIRSSGGVTVGLTLEGGDGADRISGSTAPDIIDGGAGDDVIDPGFGADIVTLGPGADTVMWNPGGGSDVLDGDDGEDLLHVFGSGAAETIDLGGVGDRARFFRDVANVTLDLGGLEQVYYRALGGADTVTLHDLDKTGVLGVEIDLAGGDAVNGDAIADTVVVRSTGAISLKSDGGALVASGEGPDVRVEHGDVGLDRLVGAAGAVAFEGGDGPDTIAIHQVSGVPALISDGCSVMGAAEDPAALTVHGHGGDDMIHAIGSVLADLYLDGGAGNDRLIGGSGADTLVGGVGDDHADGGSGADFVHLGEGADTFTWDPGKSSDTIDGDGGHDLLTFNGSGAAERIELVPAGERVRLTRDVATVTLDFGGFEALRVSAGNAADTVKIDDMAATALRDIVVDLAGTIGGGAADGLGDLVWLRGSEGADVIHLAADGADVVATGLAANVRVLRGEPYDTLSVHGLGGADLISYDPVVEWMMWLFLID